MTSGMLDPTAAALLGAFVGAVVGGLASAAGSVWVNRRELTRATRVRIYDELLPDLLMAHYEGVIDPLVGKPLKASPAKWQTYEALRRSAIIASRADARRAETLLNAVDGLQPSIDAVEEAEARHAHAMKSAHSPKEVDEANRELEAALGRIADEQSELVQGLFRDFHEYSDWLGSKIR